VQLVAAVHPRVGGDAGLAVGRDREHPPVGAAEGEYALDEDQVVVPAGVPVAERRHLQDRVVGQQPFQAGDVSILERGHIPVDGGAGVRIGRLADLILVQADGIQAGPGALKAAVHRGGRGLEHARHLRGGKAQRLPQDQDRALARRQHLHGRDQGQPEPAAGEQGAGRVGGEHRVRERLQPGQLVPAGQRLPGVIPRLADPRWQCPAGAAGQVRQAGVRRDLVHPGAQRGAGLVKLVPGPPGPQHGFLHHVLGVLHRAEHLIAVREQLAPQLLGAALEILACQGGHVGHEDTYSPTRPDSSVPAR
jgi:hypothetical protein